MVDQQNKTVQVSQTKYSLTLSWPDGIQSTFDYIWLKDNCKSGQDLISEQRMVNPMFIPMDISPEKVIVTKQNTLFIKWLNDAQTSEFELDWLRRYSYSNKEYTNRWQATLWDSSIDQSIFEADYNEVFSNETLLHDWLSIFKTHGFAKLRNAPTKPKMVLELAERLSYIWKLCYGDSFEVKGNLKKATFLGATNKALSAHTDSAHYHFTPPVQLLHCLANEVEGGESTLVDGFKVATFLKENAPEQFKLLTSHLLQFHWKTERFYYKAESPLIALNLLGELKQIRFSNQSLQPLQLPPDVMRAYYEAYRAFSKLAISDEFQIHFRFKPGDLNIIDNHRILHGRRSFSKQGLRHLEGCYLGRDGIFSQLEMLKQ